MNKQFTPSILTAALTLVLVSACGPSDLNELHQQEIDAARSAADAEVALGAASGGDTSSSAGVTTGDSSQGSDSDTSGSVIDVDSAGTGSGGATGADTDSGTDAKPGTDTSGSTDQTDGNATDNGEEPTVGAAVSGVDLTAYDMIFNDEFDGSQLDASKWNTAYQWGADLIINDEDQYYVDTQNNPEFGYDPFQFDGDALTITASRTPSDLLAAANNQPFLSGVLTSAAKFNLTYGYVEARVQLPQGSGTWPAFWMLSSEYKDLKPQLFIMEHDGGRAGSVFMNYNYHDADDNLRSPGQWEVAVDGLSSGYHTFGVEWNAEEFLFYVDGVPRYRIVGANVSAQNMYLIANLAMGGVWTGPTDDNTPLPAEYKIDYIRAYRRR